MNHVSLDTSLVVPDDVIFRELDGEAIAEKTVCLKDDGSPHTIRVQMGPERSGDFASFSLASFSLASQ